MTQEELSIVMTSVLESYDRDDSLKVVEGIDQIIAYIDEVPWPIELRPGVNEVGGTLTLLRTYASNGRIYGVDKGTFESALDTFVFGILVPWLSSRNRPTINFVNKGGSA